MDWRRKRPWGALAAIAVQTATFLALVGATAITTPYSDLLDWVARHGAFEANGDWLAYLFAPHINHRLPYSFALLDLDIRIFQGAGWPLIVVAALCLLATAALLASQALRAAPDGLRAGAAAVAAMLTLTSANALDASQPINGLYTHALLFAVVALALVEAERRPGRVRLALAFLAACAATFGNAVGLALFPALLFRRWRSGARWPELAAWLAASAAFIAAFAWGQSAPPAAIRPSAAWLVAAALEFLACLGLPWSSVLDPAAWFPGLMILGPALWAALACGGRDATRAERVAAALALFSLGVAAMHAISRTTVGAPLLPPLRYAVFMAPLHVGLLMLVLPRLAEVQPRLARWTISAAVLALLVQQALGGAVALSTADQIRDRIAAFKAGEVSPLIRLTVHPDPQRARAIYQRLEARGLYQP